MLADGGVLLVESVGSLVPVGGCAIIAAETKIVTHKKKNREKDNCIVIVFISGSRYGKE